MSENLEIKNVKRETLDINSTAVAPAPVEVEKKILNPVPLENIPISPEEPLQKINPRRRSYSSFQTPAFSNSFFS